MQNKNTIKICYLIALSLALAPTIFRLLLGNSFPAGVYPYYYAINYNLSYLNILSILTAGISLYFIYLCAKRFLKKDFNLYVLLFIISIPSIYLFNNFTIHNIIILILSISTYFYTSDSMWKKILGLLLYLSLFPLTQGRIALIIIFFLLALYEQGIPFANYIIVILTSVSIFLFDISLFPSTSSFFKIYLSELGAEVGFGASFLLLSLAGFVFSWGRKYKLYPLYIASLILIYFSYKFELFTIYLNFILVFYALISLRIFLMKEWHFADLKKITVFILIISFLYSGIVYASNFATAHPTNIDISNYNHLRNYDSGIVLTHHSNSYWVKYYGNKDYFTNPLNTDSIKIADTIFQSKFLLNATALLEQNNIKYILIDEDMKSGQTWENEGEGLLFTLPNKQYFNRIYNENGFEIYEIRAQD